jgi:hypothetical protein
MSEFVTPKYVWSRGRTLRGTTTGRTHRCDLEGCTGICIAVRWPDGKITWPCTKGMTFSKAGRVATIM